MDYSMGFNADVVLTSGGTQNVDFGYIDAIDIGKTKVKGGIKIYPLNDRKTPVDVAIVLSGIAWDGGPSSQITIEGICSDAVHSELASYLKDSAVSTVEFSFKSYSPDSAKGYYESRWGEKIKAIISSGGGNGRSELGIRLGKTPYDPDQRTWRFELDLRPQPVQNALHYAIKEGEKDSQPWGNEGKKK